MNFKARAKAWVERNFNGAKLAFYSAMATTIIEIVVDKLDDPEIDKILRIAGVKPEDEVKVHATLTALLPKVKQAGSREGRIDFAIDAFADMAFMATDGKYGTIDAYRAAIRKAYDRVK